MKKSELIKATAVCAFTGKILKEFIGDGFRSIKEVKDLLIDLVPASFKGRTVLVIIQDLTNGHIVNTSRVHNENWNNKPPVFPAKTRA